MALFDGRPLGAKVALPEIKALPIGPYSRRIEDARHRYLPLGFVIVNRTERKLDGSTHSWYFKGRAADHPEEHAAAVAAYERWKASKRSSEPRDSQPSYHRNMSKARRSPGSWRAQTITPPPKSWPEVCAEREEKMRQREPSFELVP